MSLTASTQRNKSDYHHIHHGSGGAIAASGSGSNHQKYKIKSMRDVKDGSLNSAAISTVQTVKHTTDAASTTK